MIIITIMIIIMHPRAHCALLVLIEVKLSDKEPFAMAQAAEYRRRWLYRKRAHRLLVASDPSYQRTLGISVGKSFRDGKQTTEYHP